MCSLRVLDWLVTNFSKKNVSAIQIVDDGGRTESVNIHMEYKSYLTMHKRALFDPFRRRKRVFFIDPDSRDILTTTCGQLAFFKFAIQRGVLEFATTHVSMIENDMRNTLSENRRRKKKAVASQTNCKKIILCKNNNQCQLVEAPVCHVFTNIKK